MEQNFIVTDETMTYSGHVFHRIMATCEFSFDYFGKKIDIYKGTKGGFIDSTSSLKSSNENNPAWILGDSAVYGSTIKDSIVGEQSMVIDSSMNNAIVRKTIVKQATIDNTSLNSRSSIYNSTIIRSKIRGIDNILLSALTECNLLDINEVSWSILRNVSMMCYKTIGNCNIQDSKIGTSKRHKEEDPDILNSIIIDVKQRNLSGSYLRLYGKYDMTRE